MTPDEYAKRVVEQADREGLSPSSATGAAELTRLIAEAIQEALTEALTEWARNQ